MNVEREKVKARKIDIMSILASLLQLLLTVFGRQDESIYHCYLLLLMSCSEG